MINIHLDQQDPSILKVVFEYCTEGNNLIRKVNHRRWSKSRKCWVVPNSRESVVKIGEVFGKDNCLFSNEIIKQYKPTATQKELWFYQNRFKYRYWVNKPTPSAYEQSPEIEALTREIRIRNYSYKTLRNYKGVLISLMTFQKQKPLATLGIEDFKNYLYFLVEKRNLSGSSLNVHLNAIKFYYEKVLGKPSFWVPLPTPKKETKLPEVLSVEEVQAIFRVTRIEKFRLAFQLAYSAGLRITEITNLKKSDIDFERMLIRIANGKGKKDRFVMLSAKLKDNLNSYLCKFPTNIFVFSNDETQEPLSERTIQKVFGYALQFAKIEKKVGIHSLRHSFATHLLEQGENILVIRDLLGHSDINTTLRYLHLSKDKINLTKSPFDKM